MALTSSFASIYFDIQNRLKDKATLLAWIDEDNSQLEIADSEYRPPVLFPCALIEFGSFVYEDLGNDRQTASGTVQVRVAYAPNSNTNSKTPVAYLEKGLKNYETEKQVADVLHGWSPTGCSKLMRRTAMKEGREMDNQRVRVLSFAISFTENVGENAYHQTARPDPVVGTDMLLPV